jgi:hypothetical protein
MYTKHFGKRVVHYMESLEFKGSLPIGIHLLNPLKENKEVKKIVKKFYEKYYSDNEPRYLILGINPGRLGAGSTGVPFTDTKRMEEYCNIPVSNMRTHEPSSVFVYDMIEAYGGATDFYKHFFINSVCPLGFVKEDEKGGVVNFNYYDTKELIQCTKAFILENIQSLIDLGCHTDVCFCLGTGKNYDFLSKLNAQYHFFEKVIPLDHPRYVMQYKLKQKEIYIKKYLDAFSTIII